MPKSFPQPESFRGRFDIPLIVTVPTRNVPLAKMLEIAGISPLYDPDLIKDWEGDTYRTPDKPYFTWISDGSSNLKKSIKDVRTSLTPDSRGGTLFDGIALVIKDPDILKHHLLDLPGSQVEPGLAPCLYLWYRRPRLRRRFVGLGLPSFGSVVAGKL